MKIYKCLFLLLLPSIVSAQINSISLDSSEVNFIRPPDSTGFGAPDGQLASKAIGIAGGSIVSSDGRVELIFPAGALSVNTTISIQPAINLAPNGVGKSYEFQPSGIQFKKPVQIIFHYSDEETEVCPADWMSLGMQDHNGKWTFVEYDDIDSVSKTLRASIHHFSSFTNVNDIELRPDRMKIAVKDSTMIEFVDITSVDTSAEKLTVSGFNFATTRKTNRVLWYANGIQNGDSKNGRIDVASISLGQGTIRVARYKAPAVIPKENAVAIWAEVYRTTKKGKKLTRRIKTYIEVYDKYHVSVIQQATIRAGMGSELLDSASFDVYVYAHSFQVTNIKNYAPTVIKEGKRAPFREKIIVADGLGTVHVTEGIRNDSLSHDYPPEVYFEFKPVKVLVCKFQHGARGIWSDPEPLFETSVPEEINFIANGQEQRINITNGGDMSYKLVVKPLRSP